MMPTASKKVKLSYILNGLTFWGLNGILDLDFLRRILNVWFHKEERISNEPFYSNKVFLTESEKKELSAKIHSSFEKTINKYNKSLKNVEDPSKVMMYVYEWAPIYMYLALNS